jgi:hypothetical protein
MELGVHQNSLTSAFTKVAGAASKSSSNQVQRAAARADTKARAFAEKHPELKGEPVLPAFERVLAEFDQSQKTGVDLHEKAGLKVTSHIIGRGLSERQRELHTALLDAMKASHAIEIIPLSDISILTNEMSECYSNMFRLNILTEQSFALLLVVLVGFSTTTMAKCSMGSSKRAQDTRTPGGSSSTTTAGHYQQLEVSQRLSSCFEDKIKRDAMVAAKAHGVSDSQLICDVYLAVNRAFSIKDSQQYFPVKMSALEGPVQAAAPHTSTFDVLSNDNRVTTGIPCRWDTGGMTYAQVVAAAPGGHPEHWERGGMCRMRKQLAGRIAEAPRKAIQWVKESHPD